MSASSTDAFCLCLTDMFTRLPLLVACVDAAGTRRISSACWVRGLLSTDVRFVLVQREVCAVLIRGAAVEVLCMLVDAARGEAKVPSRVVARVNAWLWGLGSSDSWLVGVRLRWKIESRPRIFHARIH